jgi:TP901 family phage tail tape measure protein
MANYNTTANVVLTVNGKQAQRMLSTLEKDAARLEKQLAKASVAGDKATMKKLQREISSTKKMIDQLKGSAFSVDSVMRRLNTATPKELNKALRQLQAQLNGIQRGTAAWDAHIAKIKLLKAEIAKVNAAQATQGSLWGRMNGWLNSASTAIMGIAAAVTGLVMAGRKAVNAYAEMEEQMANTRKYTRMTEADVLELNEAFKNMDTRLAREQLNLLAQEGGRLGYNTIQTVKEYVEAASIINVALVDLGEGATQTIAKLSTIFGMEQMYGVKEAMLKIGSTVNHLSQNCTAAKPYLVNFAQRLAGIGATAKMTIPEILAFGATLDAHGQKVEMSATALQRVIMKLFQSPKEMAKKVGLDIEEFVTTINKSTSQGVIVFLEKLKEIGSDQALAVLSPLFKDLGFDGARVASVLTNLSEHLDFLKWQMGEASQAFRDGTSASNEYAIFNNTVQASIDKARKRVSELAIELGEKLYPLMRHIYTSSSAFLRVLNQVVTFIIKYKGVIGSLIVVLTAYNAIMVLSKVYHVAYNVVVKASIALQKAWQAAVILGRVVMIAFTQGISAAIRALQLLNATTKMNPFGLLLAAATALVLVIKALCDRTSEYQKKLKEAVHSAATFNKELRKEMNNLDTLFGKLEAAKKGTKEYENVKNDIINQYGKYLNGLVNERKEIVSLEKAYKRLAAAARVAAKERAIESSRQTVQDTFDESLDDLGKQLQQSLLDYGMELKDAVKYTNRVLIGLQTEGTIDPQTVTALQAIPGSYQDKWGWTNHPVNVVNKMCEAYSEFRVAMDEIETIEDEVNPLSAYTQQQLESLLTYLVEAKKNGKSAKIVSGINKENPKTITLTESELNKYIAEAEARLSAATDTSPEVVAGNPDFEYEDYNDYITDADRRKQETEAKRAAIKARKEFKDKINNAKGDWESADATNTAEYTQGLKSYSDYLLQKHNLEVNYYDDRIKIFEDNNLQEDEDYQELLKKKEEMLKSWAAKSAQLSIHDYQRQQSAEENQLQMDAATPDNVLYNNEEAVQQGLFQIRRKYLELMRDVYNKDSEEYHSYQEQLEDVEGAERLRLQKLYATKIQEWRKKYEYQQASERMNLEFNLLQDVYDKELISQEEYYQAIADLKKKYADEYMPDNAKPDTNSQKGQEKAMKRELEQLKSLYDQGVIDKKQYEEGKDRIERAYRKKSLDAVRKFGSTETNQLLDIYEAWKNFFDATEEDGGNWATRLAALASSVFSVMSSGMQQYSEYVQACADLETAKAEKKYDREIELAEGNSYKTKKLEKDKEKELARIKNEANRKAYAMQIIQAVAQTATNALNAYGSAAQVPVIGYILAPIAAAMAVAAGALQIATIKKQQQASEAQGYSEGGFTPDGHKDEAVGVVHAGEWVASQRLTKNPQTRPLLEALDYAQRNNTIGSIRMSDVSRTINAPALLAAQSAAAPTIVNNSTVYQSPSTDNSELSSTIRELKERLSQPFVTVNTVTGDLGIKKAQDEYNKLISNKSPKSRK